MDLPLFDCSKCKDDAVGRQLGDGGESVEIVNSVGLRETPGDETSFESDDVPVGVVFRLKNPLARDEIFTGG
jgi:hypothetical protein